MAFNQTMALRIAQILSDKGIQYEEKRMFSGLCFMVDEKMCCGTHTDKKTGEEMLLCRIGDEAYNAALEMENCIPMEFTGKPMKGFVYVTGEGVKNNKDLEYWIQLCIDFNPLAKKSKKK